MPGDPINLNVRAITENTYDAIVIGSGISGGWAAKELTQKGLKVLMLERGFRHLPLLSGKKILGVFSVRDALPREIGVALGQAGGDDQ